MTKRPSSAAVRVIRCAIYTRVSTDTGLDQDFNSLDAQHEAASAYIRSQAHAGWTLIQARYDDGGFSGGSTERPDLQRLLADVRSRRIDIIVVYKVDPLTRSLADFAKLVELFDAHEVSFVSVTQQFNTTTSMGRLTLNVLLSFAQFEREVTSERIRDKIAASKRKGLWVGGPLPLGYELTDGKITIIPIEAAAVRTIFRRYLELGGVNALVRDLRQQNIRSKLRRLSTGALRGGVPFGRSALLYLLRNRFYIGEVSYQGEILPGAQPPLLDRDLFERVQHKLTARWGHRNRSKTRSDHLLTGLLYDDAGYRMTPTHATKAGRHYRYYVSTPRLHGESRTATVGTISRVPAAALEEAVVTALRAHRSGSTALSGGSNDALLLPEPNPLVLLDDVARIEIHADQLVVRFKPSDTAEAGSAEGPSSLIIPWRKPPSRRARAILIPDGISRASIRPAKIERRARLVSAIARGRRWLSELASGAVTDVGEIATRHGCSERAVNLTISFAFLAPDLVRAAVEGRLPRGIGIERLRDLPAEWNQQFEMLGLPRR